MGRNTFESNGVYGCKDPAEGHIDNLFTVEPQKLEFAYNAYIRNTPDYPQLRLTKGAHVGVTAEMTMPFEFNKGLNLAYSDTLKDVEPVVLPASDEEQFSAYIEELLR